MAQDTKDRIIARQSMSRLALDYFKELGVTPSLSDLIKITTMLENYVIHGYSAEMTEKFSRIDDFINTEYLGK